MFQKYLLQKDRNDESIRSMQTDLGKFQVLPGKEAKVGEWITFLKAHLAEVLLTLEPEKCIDQTYKEKLLQINVVMISEKLIDKMI